ncbi:hypothetical protein GCM10007863_33870 [Dyella mobilis]|nr:hypothetical protein GCM10007863_33870 [Dyella mobilis]
MCGACDDAHRLGVVEHQRQTLRRIADVQRQIGRAGLEYGEQGDEQIERRRQGDSHCCFGAGAGLDQPVGQPVGAFIELAEVQLGRFVARGNSARSMCHLRLEQRRKSRLLHRVRGVVPIVQQLAALSFIEQRQAADRLACILRHRVQHALEALRQGLHGVFVEQVGGVFHEAAQTAGASVFILVLGQLHTEVELGGWHVEQLLAAAQTWQAQRFARGFLQHQHHLVERMMRQRAVGTQRLHQLLEGQILMLVSSQIGVAHAREQFVEARVARSIGTQYQGIEEKADQPVQRRFATPGDRAADGNVGARAKPRE